MRRARLAVVGAAAVLGAAAPATLGAHVVFRDAPTPGSKQRWDEIQTTRPENIKVVRAPGGVSGYAWRFMLRQGDRGSPTDHGTRSELARLDPLFGEGDDVRFSWRIYLPSSYPVSSRWQALAQWKNEGSGSPPLQLSVTGRCLAIMANTPSASHPIWRTRLVLGRWLSLRVRVLWSTDPDVGRVSVGYRGAPERVVARRPTLYPGARNYFKFGLYRDSSITGLGVVYARDLTIERVDGAPAGGGPWPLGRC